MGITQKMKQLEYQKTVICSQCGSYGRYQVYMIYTCLSLFFIPVFSWGRRYQVQMSCCGAVYELKQEVGDRLRHGESTDIRESDLTMVQNGRPAVKRCSSCGYQTTENFEYCPKCGEKL